MPPVVSGVQAGGVESVVVGGREVDDHPVELVASLLDLLNHGGDLGVVGDFFGGLLLVLIVALHAKHELVEAVRPSLDAVNGAVLGVNDAAGEHFSIARGAHAQLVLGLEDGPGSGLEPTREEFGEGLVVAEVGVLNLAHVDLVELGVGSVDDVSHEDGEVERAAEAGHPGDDAGDRYHVLDGVVLLEHLVDRVDAVPGGEHVPREQLHRLLPVLVVGAPLNLLGQEHSSGDGDGHVVEGGESRGLLKANLSDGASEREEGQNEEESS
mmetsp:Transcript_12921/g.21866  ORF Transcript_12921/g.21866 Transcript_12921/m.21866 type:complete len:268 (-) Transcript_12921:516-1319(-)